MATISGDEKTTDNTNKQGTADGERHPAIHFADHRSLNTSG
jgi:hypothetical protein